MDNNISVHSDDTAENKRKGPDAILRSLDLLSVVLWGFTIFNFCLILYAKPQWETFFDRLLHTKVREYWDVGLLRFALALSGIQFLISLFSLYLNTKRLKRKEDSIRNSIVISIFSSLIINILLVLSVL